ncbi:Spc98 family-domain-containing protein [Peziza echinospora]|nr:Spc98 family-domain-containing protein [Peziza echinospora]
MVHPSKRPRFNTWDSFLLPDANDPTNPYLTEAGSRAFDAALELHQNDIFGPEEAGTVVRGDVFVTCLLHLGLGRSSVLFRYIKAKNCFVPVKAGLRISGCSTGTVASIVKMMAECGKNMKALQRISERVYKEMSPIPTRIALAECTSTLISALQIRLSIPASSITSIIHLESLFREPALILQTFYRMILEMRGVKDDARLLSKLFEIVQRLQYTGGSSWLKPILMELIRRVSRPWLELVEEWIGLRASILGAGRDRGWEDRKGFFVKVREETEVDERGAESTEVRYVFDAEKVPVFLNPDDTVMVFECGKSLRYLQKYHPRHPLSRPNALGVDMPMLDWKFTWESLDGINAHTGDYENKLRALIIQYDKTGTSIPFNQFLPPAPPPHLLRPQTDTPAAAAAAQTNLNTFDITPDGLSRDLALSSAAMSAPLPILTIPNIVANPLRRVVLEATTTPDTADHLTTFAPPFDITPTLSFSHIISVQANLVNTCTLRMFFTEHNLQAHFKILYRFLLLGDPLFTAQLTLALFSDEHVSSEKRKGELRSTGSGGGMGLRVGGTRDTWPPASSELRLALAGILNEAYTGTSTNTHSSNTHPPLGNGEELPGQLSFAIRELNEKQHKKVMDPHSLAALDFLKIHYKPPKPLEEVITPADLGRYDSVFMFLLRMVRVRFVVDGLWVEGVRERRRRGDPGGFDGLAEKFAIHAHHFVVALAGYVWEVAIGRNHEVHLRQQEGHLERSTSGLASSSLAQVAATHSRFLDRVTFSMFLRRRQAPVVRLLEEIFGLVLAFARVVAGRRGREGEVEGGEEKDRAEREEVKEMYYSFKRTVKTFLDVVRGLAEKRGYRDGTAGGEGGGGGGGGGGEGGHPLAAAAVSVGGGGVGGEVFKELVLRLEMNDCWRR